MDTNLISNLYINDKLSSGEIATKLNISKWQVIKKLKKLNIPRRTPSESKKIIYLKSPLSYNFRVKLNSKEKSLYLSALMLYWGEGAKRGSTVDFSNSDPKMINIFLKCLREIYRVNEKRIRVYLYCYSNQDIKKLIEYWSKLLSIPDNQFSKPYVRNDFKEKSNKMIHGLIHIRYADTKLLMQIKAEIDIISNSLIRQGGRAVNCMGL